MPIDTRHKNGHWPLPTDVNGRLEGWDYAKIAILMDLRDELQTLNRLLACPNFLGLPRDIASIRRELAGLRRDLKKKNLRSSAKSADKKPGP